MSFLNSTHLPENAGILIISLIASLGVVLYYLSLTLRKIRRIEKTPASKINLARDGKVCLQGKVYPLPNKTLISPISQQECCWYSYMIESRPGRDQINLPFGSKTSNTDEKPAWRTLKQGSSKTSFFMVNDGTGECLINPYKISVDTSKVVTKTNSLLPYINIFPAFADLTKKMREILTYE